MKDFCRWAGWEKDLAKAPREYPVSEFIALLGSYTPQEMAERIYNNRQRTLGAEAVSRLLNVCDLIPF